MAPRYNALLGSANPDDKRKVELFERRSLCVYHLVKPNS
jgi:hypothetical protein